MDPPTGRAYNPNKPQVDLKSPYEMPSIAFLHSPTIEHIEAPLLIFTCVFLS